MSTGTLDWNAERGFELDVEATGEDVTIRLSAVPVPADGTLELREGVELDRIEILFKASVSIQGEIGQLHGARVRLVGEGDGTEIELEARCEDIETGDIVPVTMSVPIRLPRGVPERGGPRPMPTNEDDLDFEDETTLEQLVVAPGEAAEEEPLPARTRPTPTPLAGEPRRAPEASEKGLRALLQALARVDDDEDEPLSEEGSEEGERPRPMPRSQREGASVPPARPEPAGMNGAAPHRNGRVHLPTPQQSQDPADQEMSVEAEAKSLLDMLVGGGNLELDGDDDDVDVLVPGVAKILAQKIPSEAKATRLSTWLLAQDIVADLFIGDDDLAEILERW